jgi:hypothetical protein
MATEAGTPRWGLTGRGFIRLALSTAVAAVIAVVAGCGTAQSVSHGPMPRPHPVMLVRDHSNGKTVHVAVGERVKLIFSSGYWRVHGSSSDAVLAQVGRAHLLPRPKSCPKIPGLGCVPFETTFTAVAKGTAIITASRQTCGEALACQPPQEHFRLTVVVG